MEKKEMFERMAQVIVEGKKEEAVSLAQQALKSGIPPLEAMNAFTKGIRIVGEKYENGEFFLPELIMGGEGMKEALKILESEINRRGEKRETPGKVIIGTVEGDIHDIGKTIVASMLSANGFEVFDLGTDVTADAFIAKIKEVGANILGLSALLTTTMSNQVKTIKALSSEGLRDKVKVIVGGAPTSQSWAEEIGADGYGENAIEAVRVAKQLATK